MAQDRPLVLLVEDDEPLRRLLETWLRQRGHPVLAVRSAEEARTLFGTQKPSLVVTDIVLPGRSGLALLRALKRRDPDVAIILLTGRRDMAAAAKAVRWEAFDFLLKPVAKAELYATVDRALRLMQVRQDMRSYTQELERVSRELARRGLEDGRLMMDLEEDLAWVRERLGAAAALALLDPQAEVEGGQTAALLLRDTLGQIIQRVTRCEESLGQYLTQERGWEPIREVVAAAMEDASPLLETSGMEVEVRLRDSETLVPAAAVRSLLVSLLGRAAHEARRRELSRVPLEGMRRDGRYVFSVVFPSRGEEEGSPLEIQWLPSAWVRRRILWPGLAPAAAQACGLGGRLLLDGSRPGQLRWTLRVPLGEGQGARKEKAA
jgi:DNA-binding response OmpR family regulator